MRRWGAFALVAVCLAATAIPALASTQFEVDVPLAEYLQESTGVFRTADGISTADTGMAIYPPTELPMAVNTFTAAVSGGQLDLRGKLPDGGWTEWTDTGTLDVSTKTVQVRLVFNEKVRSARLALRHVPIRPRTNATPLSYRVFATREGLVGGKTANGHIIVERDHFAALPSRRGLSPKQTGSYSVQVCAPNGRCAWAPVWDVGPWNTRDDYWNHPRQEWQDLPQGTPQAQAAYQNAYNNGLDQFGRNVRNPAGIDLGDGTFWDALKLTGNAWVTVTYLWTGSGPHGYVRTPGDTLNVRSGTNSNAPIVGLAGHLAQVRVECETVGEELTGSQGTSDRWLRIAPGRYVAKAYVSGVTGAVTC
ncbi:hypothetical protein [Kibdelosporangium aridum]|uniref:SH3 domain-containing protein n=1 Tax=Kibdelosporangium aridum TaxID=2030 RepID=A0A1W2D254_KIBAR|nr:hypothetical protein [Kibdelosporangium aridum]SMC91162.1 hypothetical protein SAMN05661093_02731 [Kibdelosporangium aridum]